MCGTYREQRNTETSTLRKESKEPLAMLSMTIIMVFPAHRVQGEGLSWLQLTLRRQEVKEVKEVQRDRLKLLHILDSLPAYRW